MGNPLGGIHVVGRDIRLDQSQIAAAALGGEPGGDITVQASRSLDLGGVTATGGSPSSWIVNQVAPGASGQGGTIHIAAPNLTLQDGGRIETLSLGSGAAGNIHVSADTIAINGAVQQAISPLLPNGASISAISSQALATGNGGDISLTARQLLMEGGGRVTTVVAPGATGRGGDIAVANTVRT